MLLVEEQMSTVLKLNVIELLVSNMSQLQECPVFLRHSVRFVCVNVQSCVINVWDIDWKELEAV